MKLIYSLIFILFLIPQVNGQSFFYIGYAAGHYLAKETPAENMCTKFNLGWDVGINEDNCIVLFTPGGNSYRIDNFMNWGNLPTGMRIGGVFQVGNEMGMQLGMNYMNQSSDGKRVDLTNNIEEKFALKTRMGLFTMNFVYMKSALLQPFAGFDFGYSSFRFSYSNGTIDLNNQRMGYNVKLGGDIVPGDKSLTIGFNAGCFINVLGKNTFSLKVVPSYQYILKGTGEINEIIYPDLIFNHSNLSLSFLLTYNLGQ